MTRRAYIEPSPASPPDRSFRRKGRKTALGALGFVLGALLWLGWTFPLGLNAAEESKIATSETEVKAAYIFNFTKFIQWPENAFENAGSPFVVGLVGKDTLGKTLERALLNEKVRNRPVVLKTISELSDLKDCHLLFIGPTDSQKLDSILSAVSGNPLLTISEQPGFCALGGCVNFIAEGKGVRFEMNPTALKKQGLEAHSRLLKLAKIVEK